MSSTKKLLSITDLKKYFPVAKRSLFERGRLYVRANEQITLDIYEGETVGIVGESGCGKSTLGRVLLQLYEQTAGSTMYYGRTLSEIVPSYVDKALKNPTKYLARYKNAQALADKLKAECEALGEGASFSKLQKMELAEVAARSALMDIAKIMGGFIATSDLAEAARLLRKRYKLDASAARSAKAVSEIKTETQNLKSRKKQMREEKLCSYIDEIFRSKGEIEPEISELKKKYADDAEFQKYEALLDDGVDLTRLKYSEMRHLRSDLQIIFQDPYSSLDPKMTVGQIIEEGLVTHNCYKRGSAEMRRYILKIMEECGLQDYMLHRYPHQFSGGQRQRICIARALAVKPKFVVCDECVSALDVSIQSQIINLLRDLQQREGLTYLFISHDLSVVRYISDRIAVMYLGNIVELAPADKIFSDPRHPYTVALLSSIPTTDPDGLSKERIILEGNIPSPIRPPQGCKFHTRCFMACDKCKCVQPPTVEVEPGHFVACHFPGRKIDEKGRYLFELPRMEKREIR